ncbi:MAG: threonine/serine dehydratase [Thermomicrobiales bacterium]
MKSDDGDNDGGTMDQLNLDTVKAARERLAGIVVRTPLLELGGQRNSDIWIKPEVLQPIGSFKLRGAYNALSMMVEDGPVPSAFTISTGNMSQAVAWSARRFGISARAIMPEGAPQTKIDATKAFGATVDFLPRGQLFTAMEDDRFQHTLGFIHPFRDKRVASGNGTIGLEILEDLPDVDTIYAPLGGGGLATGIAAAVKGVRPEIRVIGVEPEGCCAIARSLKSGKLERMECDTIVDSAGSPFVFQETLDAVKALLDDVITIPDDQTKAAIRLLATKNKIVAEGAAALSVAAALATDKTERGKTVCIVSGGSIEPSLFAEILTEG